MMKFMKPTAMMIDGAFGNDAAEAIGVATEVLGSAITSIAAMKMVYAADTSAKVPHTTCLREECTGARQDGWWRADRRQRAGTW